MLTFKGKQVKSSKDLQNDRLQAIKKAKNARVKVGFPSGKDSTDEDGVSALDKAMINNYGLGVPKRPFMAMAFAQNESKYKKFLGSNLLANPEKIDETLNKIGAMGKADIQNTITSLKSPPNSDLTIKLKGSSNPLIESGHMRQSVTWEIV